jgi:hypothetical protein
MRTPQEMMASRAMLIPNRQQIIDSVVWRIEEEAEEWYGGEIGQVMSATFGKEIAAISRLRKEIREELSRSGWTVCSFDISKIRGQDAITIRFQATIEVPPLWWKLELPAISRPSPAPVPGYWGGLANIPDFKAGGVVLPLQQQSDGGKE